jgi:hypothetical protein
MNNCNCDIEEEKILIHKKFKYFIQVNKYKRCLAKSFKIDNIVNILLSLLLTHMIQEISIKCDLTNKINILFCFL